MSIHKHSTGAILPDNPTTPEAKRDKQNRTICKDPWPTAKHKLEGALTAPCTWVLGASYILDPMTNFSALASTESNDLLVDSRE